MGVRCHVGNLGEEERRWCVLVSELLLNCQGAARRRGDGCGGGGGGGTGAGGGGGTGGGAGAGGGGVGRSNLTFFKGFEGNVGIVEGALAAIELSE